MIKTYIINLQRNAERMNVISARMQKLGINYERFEAIDGRSLSDAKLQSFSNVSNSNDWLHGQIGCFLSHYTLWEKAASSSDPYTAIFEDDIHVSESLPALLKDHHWIPAELDIIRLEISTNRVLLSKEPLSKIEDRKIFLVNSPTWCAGGYILSRNCAKFLLSLDPSNYQPVDELLFASDLPALKNKISVAQVFPALCIQDKFFHKNAKNIKFESMIELTEADRGFAKKKNRPTPTLIWRALLKTLQGYKRINFSD